jgi:hypothetical protein
MRAIQHTQLTAITFLLAGSLGAHAAAWGSIHGNNRSGGEAHAPAPAPAGRAEGHQAIGRAPEARGGGEQARPEEHRGGEMRGQGWASEPRGHVEIGHGRAWPGEGVWGDRRHEDIEEEEHHSYPWFGFNPGMIIGTLPPNYNQIYIGGTPYYYDQGVYYQPGPSGYEVVTPPIGAVVPQLPPGGVSIPTSSGVYYYAAGAFYVPAPGGFQVVPPVIGVTVPMLPPGATAVNANGTLLYQADGIYFQPVIQNGVTAYLTVQP